MFIDLTTKYIDHFYSTLVHDDLVLAELDKCDLILSLGHRRKDEQGWNVRSSGMMMTTIENA